MSNPSVRLSIYFMHEPDQLFPDDVYRTGMRLRPAPLLQPVAFAPAVGKFRMAGCKYCILAFDEYSANLTLAQRSWAWTAVLP